jgi:hypothetical protein
MEARRPADRPGSGPGLLHHAADGHRRHGRSWAFRCPPAGTTVGISTGGSIRYVGEHGPGLCRRGDGQTMIYGVWAVPRARPTQRPWAIRALVEAAKKPSLHG